MSITTSNGAPSHASTLDARLDLFVKTTREVGVLGVDLLSDQTNATLFEMIDKSWVVDPLDTVKILFNWRDCRGGKGDYTGFIVAMAYVASKYGAWFVANFKVIPEYGSWLDLVKLWHCLGPENKSLVMGYLVEKLEADFEILAGEEDKSSISLLAKWLPSENSKWDRYGGKDRFVISLCKQLRGKASSSWVQGHVIKTYRKVYIAPLRAHLQLVESKLCAKKFDEIKYECVPSVAMKKYRKAFTRNDVDGFALYLEQVKKGEKKINASQVYPHDLVRHYLNGGILDDVIEAQWKVLKLGVEATKAFDQSICVCDVSGSMSGTPMEVAIALGLLGLHNDSVVTFSANPTLHVVDSSTSLQAQVKNMVRMEWGMNTNLEKTMDLVMGLKEPIKRVYIFSDMQFDVAIGQPGATLFTNIKAKYARAELQMPQIVFWNLNGSTKDFPVTSDENGVVLLSGYSPALLTALVDGDDISPMNMLLKVIRGVRYEKIVAAV
jgi:hypothetical protein